MKYEQENRTKKGMVSSSMGFLKRGPDVHTAAKSGTPAMTSMRPTIPASVPLPAGQGGFAGEVTATTGGDPNVLDSKPDARANPPAPAVAGAPEATATPAATGTQPPATTTDGTAAAAPAATTDPAQLPTNRQPGKQKKQKVKKQKNAPADQK